MPNTKKNDYRWILSPVITIVLVLAGFQYTRGQKSQEVQYTIRQVTECKDKIEKQDQVNKDIVEVLQEIKIELAQVKTELKFINNRKN